MSTQPPRLRDFPIALVLFRRLLVSSSGVLIACVAASVLAGYLFEVENLTHWRGPVAMAVPTAFCFLLTGASFIVQATDFESWTIFKS